MKKISFKKVGIFLFSFLFVLMPPVLHAQSGPPPVGAQMVREGDFAVRLESALGIGTSEDEVEAETQLGQVGIAPRNGWIADYPVTPDIIGELQKTVSDTAVARRLSINKDEALKRFNDINAQLGLSIAPYTGSGQPQTAEVENYPDPTVINNYYYDEGPPVVTYYAPPPDFYYLYDWIPFPFWYGSFWFPGYFILHDFYRTIFVNHRAVFLSNHFNDIRAHRVFRVDPMARFNGRTFAGIGAPRSRSFISTGVPGSATSVFHAPHERMAVPSGKMVTPPFRGGGTLTVPSHNVRTLSPPLRGPVNPSPRRSPMVSPASRGAVNPPSHETFGSPLRGGGPAGSGETMGAPSPGGEGFSHGGGHR